MRIALHIGPDAWASARLQEVLAEKRANLAAQGVLFPRTPGPKNHTRLYMAVSDPERVDTLRFNRGYMTADRQAALRREVAEGLEKEVARSAPDLLVLSAAQLGAQLTQPSEFGRLRDLLAPLSREITVVAHVENPARMLARAYAAQVAEGRAASLAVELGLADAADWWKAALDAAPLPQPENGVFAEVQAPPHWLDLAALQHHWEAAFGTGSVRFRALDPDALMAPKITDEICAAFVIDAAIGKAEPGRPPPAPPAAWLTRARRMNDLLLRMLARSDRVLPRQLWRRFLGEVMVEGAPLDPGSLHAISGRFKADGKALVAAHPGLSDRAMAPPTQAPDWQEADPQFGYRATQYLAANRFRIDKATREAARERAADIARMQAQGNEEAAPKRDGTGPSEKAAHHLPPAAQEKYASLVTSSFRPHNRLGRVNEEELAAAFAPLPRRDLPPGSSGNVIVGCMKNEAPYIVEWVAYHRAMGVDNFLIYTNGCEDGTTEILERLQEMGVLQHRNNDDWQGNSPQQWALDNALKEPVICDADWIIHIDVDEFINVRCGNGTLADFFAAVPDATNVAMTWRLFGHNGVTRLDDRFVIDQFDTCAPKFCPKPHTVWGFKTMFRNIGAYAKISCHRPNKLLDGFEGRVKWVNGSGQDMTAEALRNGWRNSKKSIGYDLLQLNHYALRSAESFLIKRQRGRALHVDRSIGLNYWIRMDWGDFRDITIKRNIPRLRAEYDRLMEDADLARWHQSGLDWHRAKADELHGMDEFRDLFRQALDIRLNETERVAYALALDMES